MDYERLWKELKDWVEESVDNASYNNHTTRIYNEVLGVMQDMEDSLGDRNNTDYI